MKIELDSISTTSSEYDLQAIKDDVATYVSDDGWNVFHYAANKQSDSIMEELVKNLKGIGETIMYCIVTRRSVTCSCVLIRVKIQFATILINLQEHYKHNNKFGHCTF